MHVHTPPWHTTPPANAPLAPAPRDSIAHPARARAILRALSNARFVLSRPGQFTPDVIADARAVIAAFGLPSDRRLFVDRDARPLAPQVCPQPPRRDGKPRLAMMPGGAE